MNAFPTKPHFCGYRRKRCCKYYLYYIYFFMKGNDFMKFCAKESHFSKGSLPRTDLACESINISHHTKGTSYREYTLRGLSVCELSVLDRRGEAATGRPEGSYMTLHCPLIRTLDPDTEERITDALCNVIISYTERITKNPISGSTKVLVAGLGNRFISADSIGPRTADKIAVTNHMLTSDKKDLFLKIGCAGLSAVHPGVMGQTGIEAAAMIKGAAQYAEPDLVIAIDALAARSTKRLCATIQLSDTGIEPGSGIGNRRGAVNRETIGYPVLAIGVPTVVDCATLVFDSLANAGITDTGGELYDSLNEERDFFVSLRDCDIVSEEISKILAKAINRAFLCEGL